MIPHYSTQEHRAEEPMFNMCPRDFGVRGLLLNICGTTTTCCIIIIVLLLFCGGSLG